MHEGVVNAGTTTGYTLFFEELEGATGGFVISQEALHTFVVFHRENEEHREGISSGTVAGCAAPSALAFYFLKDRKHELGTGTPRHSMVEDLGIPNVTECHLIIGALWSGQFIL